MAFALPALAIAGAATSAVGAVQSGNATKSAQYYKAAVAKNNQIVSEQNAVSAIESGEAKANATALKGRAVGGAIKAKQAASGVDVNTGSAVDVQEAQREGSQLDVETVLHNADLSAYGYRVQGKNFESEAALDTAAGDQAQTAGYMKAAGGLLSSASSIGGKWNTPIGAPTASTGN